MNNEIIEVNGAEMLSAIDRAEVDMQIATARAYPRDLAACLNKIETYATMDRETAEDCFYVLRRKDANGNDCVIDGLSVRMAEIIAGAWGNLRVQTRIIGNDGRMITAQAVCHDLETNFAVSKEVKRRITNRYGKTYSEDMQVVTGNAAASIAFRNAVLTVIPKAVTKKIINHVKQVALGQAIDVETARRNCLSNFARAGVTEAMICQYLGIKATAQIDKERLFELRATWNAIKEGTTTVEESFIKPIEECRQAEEAKKKAEAVKAKATEAAKRSSGGKVAGNATENGGNSAGKPAGEVPGGVDPETGEIKQQ